MAHLTRVFTALMPRPTGRELERRVALDPLRILPAGVGGIIGTGGDPPVELVGHRVTARARVRVSTTVLNDLDVAVARTAAAVVAGDRTRQRADGLLEAELEDVGAQTTTKRDGIDNFDRDVRFRLLFEHLEPAREDRPIQTIPIVSTALTSIVPRFRLEPGIASAPTPRPAPPRLTLADVTIVDDARATTDGPSAWSADPAGALTQTSNIGAQTFAPVKPATYAVLRPGPGRGPFGDLRLEATLRSSGNGAVGVVLRWRDADNFVFVYLQREQRMIARKLGGTFGPLSPAATQVGMSFEPGAPIGVTVTSRGADVTVAVDGEPPFTATDAILAGPGRVGFMCAHEPHAGFSLATLREL